MARPVAKASPPISFAPVSLPRRSVLRLRILRQRALLIEGIHHLDVERRRLIEAPYRVVK